MALTLNDEQREFRSAVVEVLDKAADIKRVRAVQDANDGYDTELWSALVELGLPGVLIGEEHGGFGLGLAEAALALEELGRRVAPAPYLSLVIATAAIAKSGDDAVAREVLPKIAAGELHVAPAFTEGPGAWIPAKPATTATRDAAGDGWTVSGTKSFVLDGDATGAFLVLAAADEGEGLFLVQGDATGVTRTKLDLLSRSVFAASVTFENAPARRLAVADSAALLGYVDAVASTAVAAHLYGGFSKALELAVQYAKDRYQFGRPIGSFEGVKFPLADLETDRELALSLLRQAVWSADHEPESFPVAALTAVVKLQSIALEGAIRLVTTLGGIGFTWEHDAHLYQKQAATVRLLLGTPSERSERLATALGI